MKQKKIKVWAIINKQTDTLENLDLLYWRKNNALKEKHLMLFPENWKVVPCEIKL